MRVSVWVFNSNKGQQVNNILVLVSGNGTTLQALINAEKARRLEPGHIAAVVADRQAYALERARAAGIRAFIEKPDRTFPVDARRQELSDRILRIARNTNARLIILAGFLTILKGNILDAYEGRIINIHPSLLPKYGGQGMYGERVHRAVLAAGERRSGCTVHQVDSGTDTGKILLQRRVRVSQADTVDSLAKRIHKEEHIAIVKAAVSVAKKSPREEYIARAKVAALAAKKSPREGYIARIKTAALVAKKSPREEYIIRVKVAALVAKRLQKRNYRHS
jgi:phosphoribosylglycinamide formyltransferase-1